MATSTTSTQVMSHISSNEEDNDGVDNGCGSHVIGVNNEDPPLPWLQSSALDQMNAADESDVIPVVCVDQDKSTSCVESTDKPSTHVTLPRHDPDTTATANGVPDTPSPVRDDSTSASSRHLDRGWAWVVMIAAMMTHILTFGLTYAMVGIFHIELLVAFGRGDSATAWTGSILLGTMLCSGPITSILVGRFGAQATAIAGGVFSSMGLCLSALAPSLDYLFFTYGVLTGFGFGLSYLPCIVMVGRFFERRRSVATGFVVAGSGIGTFIFAPVVQIVVDEFGWRHGFLVLGAIELALCVCGATYCSRFIPEKPSREAYMKHIMDVEVDADRLDGHDLASLFTFSSHPATIGNASVAASQDASRAASNTREPSTRMSGLSFAESALSHAMAASVAADETRTLTDFKTYTEAMEIYPNRFPSDSSIAVPESIHAETWWVRCILSPCYKVARLLSNRFLVIFAISNFILCIGYQLPYVYFKALALHLSIGEDEWSFILSVMGIMDTLGRIFVGFVFDRILGKHRRMFGYVTSCILAGLCLFLVPLATGYLSLAILASLYALIAGSTDSLTPALLVAFVGLDTLGYSFGLVIEMQGAGFLVGPPLAGALYGVFEDYGVVFFAGGAAFVLAGLVMLTEPLLTGKCHPSRCCGRSTE